MNRTDFIQRVIARTVPPLNKLEAGVRYAENLWERLTVLGYGAPKQRVAKETKNWYQELNPYQRKWFDHFWIAFNYKHGRNRAALAWIKVCPFDAPDRNVIDPKKIIEAAKAEANKYRKPSETRKMAEGWLTEFRFEDHITKSKSGKGQNIKRALLKNEIKALQGFNSDGSQDDAIAKLKLALAERS